MRILLLSLATAGLMACSQNQDSASDQPQVKTPEEATATTEEESGVPEEEGAPASGRTSEDAGPVQAGPGAGGGY